MSVPDSAPARKHPHELTGWTAVPNALIRSPVLNMQETGLLTALLSHCNPVRDGCMRCWPSNAALARSFGCSAGYIRQMLGTLEAKGAIKRHVARNDNGTSRYFTFPSVGIRHLPNVNE